MKYRISEHCLGNGLRVVVNPDDAVPAVAVNLTYAVGSANEKPGEHGRAHLFEHLMNLGSRDVAYGEYDRTIAALGGEHNATTDADHTCFYQQLPAGAMEMALWLQANRMATLLQVLDEDGMQRQKQVVTAEYHEKYGGPFGSRPQRLHNGLFPEGHPYRHLTIGSMTDVQATTLADAAAFFTTHYVPGNAVLAVAGAVDPHQVLAAAERYFGPIPAGQAPAPASVAPLLPLTSPGREDITDAGAPYPVLDLAWLLPANSVVDSEIFACDAALRILAEGSRSRAYGRLVKAAGIAHTIEISVQPRDLASIGAIVIGLVPGADIEPAEAMLLEELHTLARSGPTQAEMRRWRAASHREVLADAATITDRAGTLAGFTASFGDPEALNTTTDRINAVEAGHVQAAAARWLASDARMCLASHPEPAPAGTTV